MIQTVKYTFILDEMLYDVERDSLRDAMQLACDHITYNDALPELITDGDVQYDYQAIKDYIKAHNIRPRKRVVGYEG